MDCKKALQEAEGDMEKAIEILRLKGQKVAAKRSDREASEGAILSGVSADGKTGVVLSLNCETDFVAKNEDFIGVAKTLLDLALAEGCENKDAILGLNFPGSDITVADKIVEETGKIGERIEKKVRDMIGGKSKAPGLASAKSISQEAAALQEAAE